jgi:hypothetical protein
MARGWRHSITMGANLTPAVRIADMLSGRRGKPRRRAVMATKPLIQFSPADKEADLIESTFA